VYYLLPTACCLLPTACCLPPTAYCPLPTAYCVLRTAYCVLRTAYCVLPTIFILTFFTTTVLSQADPHLDSLKQAIRAADGKEKADLIVQYLAYSFDTVRGRDYPEYLKLSKEAYSCSQIGQNQYGIAKASLYKGISYGATGQHDSTAYYCSKALNIFMELNDSFFLAKSSRYLAWEEFLLGNYNNAERLINNVMNYAVPVKSFCDQKEACEYLAEIRKANGELEGEENFYRFQLDFMAEHHINPSTGFINLAKYHLYHGNYKECIRYSLKADSAIRIIENVYVLEYHDRKFMQAKMKGMVARAFRLWGYYDSALVWHRRAVAGMQAAPEHAGVDIPNQWEGIGYVYTQKGIYDSARIYLEKSATRRYELNDFLGAGESYDGLGYLCWLLGDEAGAVKYYTEALEMKSMIDEKTAAYRRATFFESQSVSFLQIGKAYASWGMQESAGQNLEESLALCREIGYRKGEAEALIEFGKLKGLEGDLPGAEKDFTDALRIFAEIDYKPGQADAISSLGDLFFADGAFDKSLDYYKQAEYILQRTQNPIMLTDAWTNTGLALAAKGNYLSAEEYLLKALEQSVKFNLFRRNMRINKALADFYSESGKETLAIEYYADFLSKRDSINRQKTYFLLADLQSRNEADMKLRQLELLGKENKVKELTLARSNGMMIGVFGLILLLILLSLTIYRTLRLKESHREALLQQRLFRARMSPGFINHSIGNVKKLVMESKNFQASDYITYFSRMMQHLLEGSRHELVVFSKGLSMLKSYFELNKLGQDELFGYEIIVDPQIGREETMVPSFLEEVITPGYKAETGRRFVRVTFTGMERKIGVCVESRGSVASLPGLSSQDLKALINIRSRLMEMGKKYKVSLDFSLSDLIDADGNVEGKRLDFEVPAIFD